MNFWWISSYYGEIPNNAVLLLCPSKLWRSRVHFVTGSEIPASIAPHGFHGFKTSSREFQLVPVMLVVNKLHSPLWEHDEPPDCSWTWPLLWNADQVCGVSNLFLLSIKRAIMQIYRTMLWAHLRGNTEVLNMWNPFIFWQKGKCGKSETGHPCASLHAWSCTQNGELQVEDSDFRSLPSLINSVAVTRGIFWCIHMRWEKCPLL